jgi:AAA+ superfamily predicted ATPase
MKEAPMKFSHTIHTALKARLPGLFIRTAEEERAIEALRQTCYGLMKNRVLLRWSVASGLHKIEAEPSEDRVVNPEPDLGAALSTFRETAESWVLVLADLPKLIHENPVLERLVRETLAHARQRGKTLIVTGVHWTIPNELADDIYTIDLPLPDYNALNAQIGAMCETMKEKIREVQGREIQIDEKSVPALARACQGMTIDETKSIVALSLSHFQAIGDDAVKLAIREKRQIVKRTGVLEFHECSHDMDAVGGLGELKKFLSVEGQNFGDDARKDGIDMPKGVLLVGPPGTGKTHTAAAIATMWQRPRVDMDVGTLKSKWVGESEGRLRLALATAEAIAPCVLFIDEIEKAFKDGGESDGNTTSGMLAYLLKWMQDKTSDVYVVAASNDVSKMPDALLRKGRFDEIFFVDLPNHNSRCEILSIHLAHVKAKLNGKEIGDVADATNGFSGAELRSVVQSAKKAARAKGKPMVLKNLIDAATQTVPLSKAKADTINKLREFCKSGHARPADGGTLERDAHEKTHAVEV